MHPPALRRFFVKRFPIQRQWQHVRACSTLAAVRMLAVLALTDRLLTAHVEAAQSQADDAAQVLIGRFARVLERRVEDLQQVTRSVALADLDKPVEVRAELDRLRSSHPTCRRG